MAGFSKMYLIGGEGGFQGTDVINPISLQIWVGNGSRQWLEPHYIDESLKPLGSLRVIIPAGPDDPDSILDACLAFHPQHFNACPSLTKVESELSNTERLDFDLGKDQIPKAWQTLRAEARPVFETLSIYEAKIEPFEHNRAVTKQTSSDRPR